MGQARARVPHAGGWVVGEPPEAVHEPETAGAATVTAAAKMGEQELVGVTVMVMLLVEHAGVV